MKSSRTLVPFLMAAAISTLAPSIAFATDAAATPKTSADIRHLAHKPSADITAADIEKVFDAIVSNRIDVENLAVFMGKLDDHQRQAMRLLLADKANIDVRAFAQSDTPGTESGFSTRLANTYVETIENVWTWDYNPKIFASFYYQDKNCDGDASDNEYVFYYPVSTSSSTKGNLRWTTTSPLVYAAFSVAYGGNISAFGTSWGEVRLCIGDSGVSGAGGAGHVASTVFIHY